MDNIHRIGKYKPRRIQFVSDEKSAGPQISSNTNEPLDFTFTNELINEIVRETNNYALKKLEGKVLLLYLP